MSHFVICPYCGKKFDRDKEKYAVINNRRYAHVACMLQKAETDPKYQIKEIIDPSDYVKCIYCKNTLSKKDNDCIEVTEGRYAHKKCQEIEDKREKTDKEQLDDYIKKLFQMQYVDPKIQLQIKKYVQDYNYTYSGIQKALQYYYEIKNGDKSKAKNGIGIVPYIYKDAYNYFYNIWLAQQQNKDKVLINYVPKVREVTILRPQREIKKKRFFQFLNEEND